MRFLLYKTFSTENRNLLRITASAESAWWRQEFQVKHFIKNKWYKNLTRYKGRSIQESDQGKFMENNFEEENSKKYFQLQQNKKLSDFFKAVFHKFYLVRSWILCLIWCFFKYYCFQSIMHFIFQAKPFKIRHPELWEENTRMRWSGLLQKYFQKHCFQILVL